MLISNGRQRAAKHIRGGDILDTIHPKYVVDEQGVPHSVVLDIAEFKQLLERAGGQAQEPRPVGALRVSDLGWTREQTLDTRTRLCAFEDDWDAPGMDAYDGL